MTPRLTAGQFRVIFDALEQPAFPSMTGVARALDAIGFLPEDRHGPLPLLLLVLTTVTGVLDAVSYLALGHVFVGNMTGNVLFLGFGVAGVAEFSILGSLFALTAFLLGAFAGGGLGTRTGRHRGRLLAQGTSIMIVLVGAVLLLSALMPHPANGPARYALIVCSRWQWACRTQRLANWAYPTLLRTC